MKTCLAFLLTAAAITVAAEDIKTIDGKEYKGVTISRAEPDGLVITASYGIIKIPFEELPPKLREKFHYDPQAGAKYRQELDANERSRKQAIDAAQQKRAQQLAAAEEKAKSIAVVSETPAPAPDQAPSGKATKYHGTMLDESTTTKRSEGTMLDQPGTKHSHGTMLDQPVSKHWAIVGSVFQKPITA